MKVATYEGIVENGQVKLTEAVRLPEHAKLYVVVAGVEEKPGFISPAHDSRSRNVPATSSKRLSRNADDGGRL